MHDNLTSVFSFGGGVQSTTILLLALDGLLPLPEYMIFADTRAEPAAVYRHVDHCEKLATAAGIKFHRVSGGDLVAESLKGMVRTTRATSNSGELRFAPLPYTTLNADGTVGRLRRQCTGEFKIDPINAFIRQQIMHLKPRQRAPQSVTVEQWFGISVDEMQRMRASIDRWARYWHPLIERRDGSFRSPVGDPCRMTRDQCHAYLTARAQHYGIALPVPKSACVMCPFRADYGGQWSWRDMKENAPEEFQWAVEFDKKIRRLGGVRGDVFIHRSATPLDEVDFSIDTDHGQLDLFEDECQGMCGV